MFLVFTMPVGTPANESYEYFRSKCMEQFFLRLTHAVLDTLVIGSYESFCLCLLDMLAAESYE